MVQEILNVKYKKVLEGAKDPSYSREGDVGIDLVAVSVENVSNILGTVKYIEYDTGLAFEIPKGYYGQIVPRSSISEKDLILSNSVGIIDSNYRGTIKARFKVTKDFYMSDIYLIGERICQLIILPYPNINLEEASELSETNRGSEGFGSSGK